MIIEWQGAGQQDPSGGLKYMEQTATVLAPTESCRYLGIGGTATGDMTDKEKKVFRVNGGGERGACSGIVPALTPDDDVT